MSVMACAECGSYTPASQLAAGICRSCRRQEELGALAEGKAIQDAELSEQQRIKEQALQEEKDALDSISLTTEGMTALPIKRRLGVVAAEAVIGLHIFKDIMVGFRDFFGGRSATLQKGLRQAREAALDDLRREARDRGANAVIGISITYSEISLAHSMLMVVATGTAVELDGEAQ